MKKHIIFVIIGLLVIILGELSFEMFTNSDIFQAAVTRVSDDSIVDSLNTLRTDSETIAGANVPEGDLFTDLLPNVITLSLQVFGTVMFVVLVIAGIWLTLGGISEDFLSEAKKMVTYALIGAIIVTISFAIVYGITQINFSEQAPGVVNNLNDIPGGVNNNSQNR